jgi:hypothetical protein
MLAAAECERGRRRGIRGIAEQRLAGEMVKHGGVIHLVELLLDSVITNPIKRPIRFA